MYNLTVEGTHIFFVGEEQWLVHNQSQAQPQPLTLYRVVSDGEYAKIMQSGQFSTVYGTGYEGKQFWTSLADAEEFAKLQGGGKIVATVVPNPNKVSIELGIVLDLSGEKPYVLTTGQTSIRCVQNFDIHPCRILDLTSLTCLTQTRKHRIRPASRHMLDLQGPRA
jgi:hypothetical protein